MAFRGVTPTWSCTCKRLRLHRDEQKEECDQKKKKNKHIGLLGSCPYLPVDMSFFFFFPPPVGTYYGMKTWIMFPESETTHASSS